MHVETRVSFLEFTVYHDLNGVSKKVSGTIFLGTFTCLPVSVGAFLVLVTVKIATSTGQSRLVKEVAKLSDKGAEVIRFE